ncbi:DUF3653 domain-containing protein [Lysobacter capsici]|uniref:DUF3653 domain-containing protein n=1 Tax=Lysobacter capsici TaxID=435897 RepID=UPI001C006D1C|nr:DUF3653 domain-containing protein [Lysobacter capsici]QWF14756.1 phage protein [Lysobacter capsici]
MNIDLDEEWSGWRLRGRYLISDDGLRIPIARLRGLLWREKMELRRDGYASRRNAEQARLAAGRQPRIKVIVIDLAEYRLNGLAAS